MTNLDPESLRVLNLAREARTPSEEDKARVGRRLGIAVGASVAAAAASTSATASAAHAEAAAGAVKGASSTSVAAWMGGGALVVAVAIGYVALWAPRSHVSPRASRVAPVEVAPASEAPASEAPAVPMPQAQPEPQDPARALDEAQGRDARTTPRRVAQRHALVPTDSLGAELELLHRAQIAWRARRADEALSLLNDHRARYPRSQLDLERDALQVLTLCELGRSDEAKRIARSVLARAPHSPLRASLEQSCALK